MKIVAIETTNLDRCVTASQSGQVVVTRNGAPVAVVLGVSGLDKEQIELGTSAEFWNLIQERRKEKTLTRAELESRIRRRTDRRKRSASAGKR